MGRRVLKLNRGFRTKTRDEFGRVKDKFSNKFSGVMVDKKTVQVVEGCWSGWFLESLCV